EDGRVSELDALVVINHLAREASLVPEDMADAIGTTASEWVDVNADGRATPIDALTIINQLGREQYRDAASGLAPLAGKDPERDDEVRVLDETFASWGRPSPAASKKLIGAELQSDSRKSSQPMQRESDLPSEHRKDPDEFPFSLNHQPDEIE
ncbi:dockerin type I domain-containing protein, partial [Stieleria sp.]|uniref:dockerin type I domain-containing protein n=1 Tax=Stieleria sp. TaxID=2795976 RepID=UPI003564D072